MDSGVGRDEWAIRMVCGSHLLVKRVDCPFSEVRLVSVFHRPWPCISNLLCSLSVGIKIKKEVANAFMKRQKRSTLYEW